MQLVKDRLDLENLYRMSKNGKKSNENGHDVHWTLIDGEKRWGQNGESYS